MICASRILGSAVVVTFAASALVLCPRVADADEPPPAPLLLPPLPAAPPAPPSPPSVVAPTPPSGSSKPPSTPPPPPPLADASVIVHLEGRHQVGLDRRGSPFESWTRVCESPCDIPVPLDGEYRIAPFSLRGSAPFRLNAPPGVRLVLHTEVKNALAGPVGFGLLWVGAATVATGLVWLIVAPDGRCVATEGDGGCVRSDLSGQQTAALVTAGIGALVMAAGVGIEAAPSSHVTGQTVGAFDAPATAPSTAWRRAPVWRSATETLPPTPTAWTFPVFSRRF